jgi:AraC family transcriptional regulator of adaptative response / DNA-3-methyladenine glycosylase II
MDLEHAHCYRALRTRDPRFDGRFFTAVRSTGIYCRPICPAPTPKPENCLFLPCAAAAAELGYRPCRRCRPEASPGTPAWLGTSTTVSRGLRLISDGALDRGSVSELAARVGVGERQLRRLFLKHLGASPVAIAQTRRILFAKRLIDESSLSMAQVGLSAGFSSVRRFNEAIRSSYGRSPRELRGQRGRSAPNDDGFDLTLSLTYRPPFDWNTLQRFLAIRAIPGVESVSEKAYRRTLVIDDSEGLLEVAPVPGANHLIARIRLEDARHLQIISQRVQRIFDLGADPSVIASDLGRDPILAECLRAVPGVRVPGAWDGFELAVRAILGQQVSVKGATTLSGRLAARFGRSARLPKDDADLSTLFPTPGVLADSDIAAIGLPQTRAEAIRSLSQAVTKGELDLDSPWNLDDAIAKLTALPGIGEWTAHYIAMRALREPDAFPHSDLGLRRVLGDSKGPISASRLRVISERWRPWRAYAAMLLWTSPPIDRATTNVVHERSCTSRISTSNAPDPSRGSG